MERRGRKYPAHPPVREIRNRATIVFVTVCTQARRPILANRGSHDALVQAWKLADHWAVGRYVVMPDHVHLFCSPARPDALASDRWVAYWKSLVSRTWAGEPVEDLWQRSYWDTKLRRRNSYSSKWHYVVDNPVRRGLVRCAQDWPYQGELNDLSWFDYT